jgi:copper chaperone NosL
MRRLAVPWTGLLLLFAACGGGGSSDGPPEIRYGLEECSYCRMIVSEERFAAALTAGTGRAVFDDVGCLVSYLGERQVADPAIWVHDHAARGWLRASGAWFVRDPAGGTPMGSGLVAFAERSAAEAFAGGRGVEVLSWDQLSSRAATP